MEWVLRSPQIHSTFGSLGYVQADGYHVNENCNSALESILQNILTEDKYLRTYRRNISFGQNIRKDLIPLLIHAKEDKTIELLIRVLVNLTIPIECLLSMDVISKTDFGRHTIFEINNLLAATKAAFTDHRTTKVIMNFLKKNIEVDQKAKLSLLQIANISNSLLLLRNILHIPEEPSPSFSSPIHDIQNQILWNIFSQGVDKVLIQLMIIPDATNWSVTMVQLIALLYKDQHVVTLHKLLNLWLDASLSESSEDNESNTSSPDRGSKDSSPMLTSDPTSDSSDTGRSRKSNDETDINSVNNDWYGSSANISDNGNEQFQPPSSGTEKESDSKSDYNENTHKDMQFDNVDSVSSGMGAQSKQSDQSQSMTNEKKAVVSENSDCGYGTQIENQESISTSSNEDELPAKKPVHQKPHNTKQRMNNKVRSGTIQDRKRKKIVKRGKLNIINVQGLSLKTPTDDDISNILKGFTVDFLLKGYNSLVQTLHSQILTNLDLEIDTSHFFWLVTYFLKFATQIELDLEHVSSVLSFDIVSYLTAEGVNLCEQFELGIKLDGNDLKPSIRRLHLVVTAIREFVQAIEVYKKCTHICKEDQDALIRLQIKMCETEELRSLLVLLLRHYNPKYHSKQYLQDIVITNHILLTFLDNVMKLSEYTGNTNMQDHIKQFAATEVMYQYGLLLEDYAVNGEFVNDCIFTMMHHIGGEIGSIITLFQPKILKTFTSIWKSEFEICDDWSDLIEYVINTFIKKPPTLQGSASLRLDAESFDDDNVFAKPDAAVAPSARPDLDDANKSGSGASSSPNDRWTDNELSSLSWNYMQCSSQSDSIGELVKLFKEDGIVKTRSSVIKELFKQNLIDKDTSDKLLKGESERSSKSSQNKEVRDDEISKICEQLAQDGKSKSLDWVQKVLLETCYVKIYIEKQMKNSLDDMPLLKKEIHVQNLSNKPNDFPVVSSVSYHSLLSNQSVPLVPWNCEQAATCKDLKFLQLLHKLGFHMPVDSGKVFIRIPHFWNAEILYEVSGKILPVDKSKLKFSLSDIITDTSSGAQSVPPNSCLMSKDLAKDVTMIEAPDNFYQVHKQKHLATMVNFTPTPGSSFNPDGGELDKPTWFELIQKSQEYKLILNLGRHTAEVDEEAGPTERMCEELPSVLAKPALVAPPPPLPHSLLMPALPSVMTVKQDASAFNAQLAESEYYNHSCPALVAPPPLLPHSLLMPALPSVMTVKQDASAFNAQLAESEYYNHSVCETASVASDLTRMYVSDEDEKPEVLILPVISVDPVMDEPSYHHITSPGKRARVQFSPTFYP